MSSTTASSSKNMRAPGATLSPSSASTPRENATSVASGIVQLCWFAPCVVITPKINAGMAMPPSAANAGRAAARRSRSSPTTTSRLISSPTRKKNNVISPSSTTARGVAESNPKSTWRPHVLL